MKVLFLGSGAFGLPTLQALAEHHQVVGVVTQPDRPAGRGKDLTPTPVGEWAAQHLAGVPLFKPENINAPGQTAAARALDAQAWVVIAFGQKLGPALLDGVFAINLHASLLPRWRGAAPINAALLAGDAETGNSVITLADRMDAGLILAQSRRPIDPASTAGELHDLLAADGPPLVEQVLAAHAAGTLQSITQDESLVTKAKKLSRADAALDFNGSVDEVRRRIHGLTPWPGVTIEIHGRPLKLLRVRSVPGSPAHHSGLLVDPATGVVSCGSGTALQLLSVQPPGGRAMDWGDYLRGGGRTLAAGAVCSSPLPPGPPTAK